MANVFLGKHIFSPAMDTAPGSALEGKSTPQGQVGQLVSTLALLWPSVTCLASGSLSFLIEPHGVEEAVERRS